MELTEKEKAQLKKLRVPVLIDRDVYDKYKTRSERTGLTVTHLIRKALERPQPCETDGD